MQAYLDVDGIVALAKEKGVDAIHPGYGFLSENPALPRACEAAGITFVGPSAELLETAGRQNGGAQTGRTRQRSRRARHPGADLAIPKGAQSGERNRLSLDHQSCVRRRRTRHARGRFRGRVRRPIGGGAQRSGMPHSATARYFWNATSAARATSKCRSWAISTATCCICTNATVPCSGAIRRWWRSRPPLNSNPRIRDAIADAAVTLAREAGYYNAGTVEFLVDADTDEWYFIEVNPRIQVEHTVTEMVTGIDLVRSQILIAQGHTLHDPTIVSPAAGQDSALWLRAAMPHHHRGSREQLHARLRQDPDLSLARRFRHAAGWRIGVRRRDHYALITIRCW